ncbi:Threonyl-tRNA synthetase [Hordeum vulgare]|nr:Threonyl-tRNA synthetase [Hordeum vulgare]
MAEADDSAAAASVPPPPARRSRFAPPWPIAPAPPVPAKALKARRRPASRARNPAETAARPAKNSKAAATARADDWQLGPTTFSTSQGAFPPPSPPQPPVVEGDLATPTVTTSNMFDEIRKGIKDYFYDRNTSGHFRSSDSIRQRWSTINVECQKWVCRLSNVARMNPSGCGDSDLKMIAQGLFRERNMKGEKKKRKGKAFTFHHCFKELKDEEKWKTRETFDASKKKSVVIEYEEDDASKDTSPTPNSATKSYRPDGNKKVKGTKATDNDLKEGFGAIVTVRKEHAEEKIMLKLKEIEERSSDRGEVGGGQGEEARTRGEKCRGRGEEGG